MADQAETPKILDEITNKTNSRPGRKRARGRTGFIFLMCLLLPVIAGVAYLGYQQWLMSQDMKQLAANRGDDIATIDTIASTVTELQGQSGVLAELNSRYEELSSNTDLAQLRNDYAQLRAAVELLVQENAQLQVSVENQSATIASLQNRNTQLQQIQTQLAQGASEIVIDNSAALEVEQRLNSRISQLTQQINQLQTPSQAATDDSDLYLTEAEHLLRLANQKLDLVRDVAGALTILQSVDQLLTANSDSNAELRQQLEQDRAALQALELPDTENLLQEITAAQSQINTLVLANSLAQSRPDLESAASTGQSGLSANPTSGFWSSSADFLNSVFVWRHWEETPDAQLPAVQDSYSKQSLYLWLEQAKLALLSGDQERFEQSIANTAAWLNNYSITEDEASQRLLTELQNLASITIRPELPAVSSSLLLVRQLIEQSTQ